MRAAVLAFALLLVACSASWAQNAPSPDPVEIRLGDDPPPPPPDDRAPANAVERFLAARQQGSIDSTMRADARAMLHGGQAVSDESLFGRPGQSIAAFDFHDESVQKDDSGNFEVSVYLLLAGPDGRVVESRDEMLAFRANGGDYACTAVQATNVIAWGEDGVVETARSLEASRALDRAERFLQAKAAERTHILAYSLADVERDKSGRVVVQCLRFQANLGKRGFDVTTTPLVVNRDDSVEVGSN
jgi:hypothetical protein